jgi:hypothetical protein
VQFFIIDEKGWPFFPLQERWGKAVILLSRDLTGRLNRFLHAVKLQGGGGAQSGAGVINVPPGLKPVRGVTGWCAPVDPGCLMGMGMNEDSKHEKKSGREMPS